MIQSDEYGNEHLIQLQYLSHQHPYISRLWYSLILRGKILACKYTYIIDVTFPILDMFVSIFPFLIEHSLVEKRIVKHAIELRPRSVPLLFT
jgi:hypothetical protein